MKHPKLVWLLFGCSIALAAAALAWVDRVTRRLDRSEAAARGQAALEQRIQLALWRIDSALSPLIAEEATRPYFQYRAFYPAERAYTAMYRQINTGEILVPSPLLSYTPSFVQLHFQFQIKPAQSGVACTSPQVPNGNPRDVAEVCCIEPGQVDAARARLDKFTRLVRADDILAALEHGVFPFVCPSNDLVTQDRAPEPSTPLIISGAAGEAEFASRTQNVQREKDRGATTRQVIRPAWSTHVRQGPLRAFWRGPALLLARRVETNDGLFVQGCWLDWNAIEADLIGRVSDLLPGARLVPIRAGSDPSNARLLATLPVRFDPGSLAAINAVPGSLTNRSLAIAWGCLALAAVAAAFLLHGAMLISERRGTFVSAVSHELRTPLTTLRLYADMLAEGMIDDPGKQRSYLATMRDEADRLGRLVENVLAMARLERGRNGDRKELIIPADLLDRIGPKLAARAEREGMRLEVAPAPTGVEIEADVSLVDQILSNLVDNACKYAQQSKDRRIELASAVHGGAFELTVTDHGPGLSPRARSRIFRPFSRPASEAAGAAPGVGLGLALSRRLARSLGGDLQIAGQGESGASFRLTLPLARPRDSHKPAALV